MNYIIKILLFLACASAALAQTTPIRNPQVQGTSGSIISGATLTNNGTFINSGTMNGAGTFNFGSGTVTLPATVGGLGSWTGSGSITTLGTITTGIWNGTTLAAGYGGTGQTSIAASVQALLDSISTTQGTIIYNNGTDWVALAPGTSGHFLKTQGAAANPVWAAATAGSGTVTSVAVSGSDGIEIDSGSPITTSGTIALGVNVAALSSHLGLGALATLNAVGSGQITDGAIVDADINPSAGIAYTKMEAGSIFTYSTGGVMTKYSTLAAAKAAATSGQTIFVGPGTYAVTDSLMKDGVNWHFAAEATVTRTTTSFGIWDDEGSNITSVVTGEGVFITTATGSDYMPCVHVSGVSSSLTLHARSIGCVQSAAGTGTPIAIWGSASLRVVCSESIYGEDQSAFNVGIAVYWDTGNMHVSAPRIYADNVAVYSHSSISSTGDFYVDADIIEGTASDGGDQPGVIYDYGLNTAAAAWITARIVKSSGNDIAAVANHGGSRLYVTAQKIFGRIETRNIAASGGQTYINADKIEAVGNGSSGTPNLIYSISADQSLRVAIRQWSPVSYTGETIKIIAGTAILRGGDFTGGASAKGIEVTGGALTLEGATINTAANSGTNAVTVSGGTVILTDNHFTSHASGKDVAQSGGTVTVSGGYGTGTGGVLTTSGAVGNAIPALINLTSNVTGTLPVANGGTSATTAAGARVSLLPSMTGNTLKVLRVNAGETDYELATVSSGLTIGTTTITSGTSGRVLYDNAGVVGEMTTTGSGTVLALATSPTFTTPVLGAATAASIQSPIGTITPASGSFTTLAASGDTTLANLAATRYQGIIGDILPAAASFTTVVGATGTWSGAQTVTTAFSSTAPNVMATLENTQAATVGVQRASPIFVLSSNGWKTTATAASVEVETGIYQLPIQGTTAPDVQMAFAMRTGGSGAWTDIMHLYNEGSITKYKGLAFPGALTISPSLTSQSEKFTVESNSITKETGAVVKFYAGILGVGTLGTGYFAWGSSTSASSFDTFLYRGGAAATVEHGADVNGDAVDQVIKSADGITGTDRSGADFDMKSGLGTGAGAVSKIVFSTPTVLASGTTAQSYTERMRINSSGITIGSGTAIAKVKHGTATLVAGTVTVSDSDVVAGSRIFVNRQTDGGTLGDSYSVAITAATNFVIQSKTANANVAGDTSTVSWIMVNP